MSNEKTPGELPPLPTIEMEESEFKRLNRRRFLSWSVLSAAGLAGLGAIAWSEWDRELQWPLRQGLNAGDALWKANFNPNSRASKSAKPDRDLRLNGDIGIQQNVDVNSWRLQISHAGKSGSLSLSLADLKALPRVTETFELKCIEGWSQSMTCTGVRFSEFMKQLKVGFRPPDPEFPEDETLPFAHAGLSSVDGAYYVSMDMKSLLHPQTLLCYDLNGKPLTADHGFPLRLMTPVKYGVKNIKQIGRIAFADTPPADYWAESGYGDYNGL